MPSFAVSIGLLGLLQAALVALPRSLPGLPLAGLRSRWWALVPALSIVVVIAIVNFDSDSATALAYLALIAVPPSTLEAGIGVQGCHTVIDGAFKLRTTNASAGAINPASASWTFLVLRR